LRDWIYGKHLLRGIVSMTIASGAVGKTSLKIVEALALATGRNLLGHDVPKRSGVCPPLTEPAKRRDIARNPETLPATSEA
jgi:RecA-family ATPase